MLERTKKHRIRKETYSEDPTMTADEYIQKASDHYDLPVWALMLAGARHKENLTQSQLAELVGLKQSNISAMERGKKPIGKVVAHRLAKVLNTDYRRFL